jgi:hypothetical protein
MQQMGVPPIIRQQAQPAFMQPMMQSQHAWIMSQHALSPLVQVRQHPSAVISHLHIAIVRLQQQTVMPFIVQQTLHIPPAIIAQRFCIIVQAAGSSHLQVTFIPPAHFSTFIAHRGTITMFGAIGNADGFPRFPSTDFRAFPTGRRTKSAKARRTGCLQPRRGYNCSG